eukprot:1137329-Pelagomonas_calceolata.AAC.5
MRVCQRPQPCVLAHHVQGCTNAMCSKAWLQGYKVTVGFNLQPGCLKAGGLAGLCQPNRQ